MVVEGISKCRVHFNQVYYQGGDFLEFMRKNAHFVWQLDIFKALFLENVLPQAKFIAV
jgi:hypothetical protein